MTRIGFAYNQKPDAPAAMTALRAQEETADAADEEPPSSAPTAFDVPDDEFAEWDGIETIDAVAAALSAYGEVVRLEATPDFPERLRALRPDIVFNIAEGLGGANREAHVPAICEFHGIPYSASDPFTLSLCLDKARAKEVLSYHGVPNAPFVVVDDARALDLLLADLAAGESRLGFPLFVKPLYEGSSKGITERNLCRDASALAGQTRWLMERYRQPVLVERYLDGAEFTCAVLGNGDAAEMLPIVGINFAALPEGALPVYGFEAKWLWDRPEEPLDMFDCPARVSEPLRAAIERVVLRAYRVLGCRDWARVDVRLDADGVPNVVEVNPLPGILPDPAANSCLPKAARVAGMDYDTLIQRCLLAAAVRMGIRLTRRTTGTTTAVHAARPHASLLHRP
jgi:D-alanine-D-alanine ligase